MARKRLRKVFLSALTVILTSLLLYTAVAQIFQSGTPYEVPADSVHSDLKAPRKKAQSSADDDFYSRYTWKNGSHTLVGKHFNIPPEVLRSLALPVTDNFTELTDISSAADFVFVTGVSDNHFGESKVAITLVQKHFPTYKIYYYDLGLQKEQVNEVRTWCGVEYRKFNFSKYPKHVKELRTYSFKPLIMHDILRTKRGVFWVDASIRFYTDNIEPILKMATQNGGFVQFGLSPHSVFAATDPKMWDYLVADPTKMKQVRMYAAGYVLLFKTRKVYDGLLHWYVMCALDKECMTPSGSSRICPKVKDTTNVRADDCHRQDQSAMNTLAANLYNFTQTSYICPDSKKILTAVRSKEGSQAVKVCRS